MKIFILLDFLFLLMFIVAVAINILLVYPLDLIWWKFALGFILGGATGMQLGRFTDSVIFYKKYKSLK